MNGNVTDKVSRSERPVALLFLHEQTPKGRRHEAPLVVKSSEGLGSAQ